MNSNSAEKNTEEYTFYTYIKFFFTIIGIISYLASCLLFALYFKAPNLIKSEIFTYILFHTLKNFVDIILPQNSSPIFIYCFGIIEFFLIISHLDKCFSSKNISENTKLYELEYKYYIIIAFIICSFPYEQYFELIDQHIFSLNVINLILAILFFRYINIKMGLILDYLKDKKVTNSSIPDIYLPYVKANYYYTNFNKINKIFYLSFSLVIIYYIINILNLFFDWKILYKYLVFFSHELIYISIVISCLAYFYCLNKDLLTNNKIQKEEAAELNKFRVIDVDIQHEEDENILEKKNNINNKNNRNENENEEEDKFKKGDKKVNDESEKLKN